MRRTLIIISTIIVLLGIGAGIYFYFFYKKTGVEVAQPVGGDLPIAGQGNTTPTETPTTNISGAPTPISARLIKITAGPVVPGEVVTTTKPFDASSSPETSVTYIERQSGNVYSYQVNTSVLTRTSNKTIPGIEEAVWLPDASTAFVRYLSGSDFSTINTYALPSNGSDGSFLPQNLAQVAVSSTSVLALASGVNGSAASLKRADGTQLSTVFTTPLSAVRVSFAGKNQYLAFTKPSATLGGSAFIVDSTGHFSRIAGPRNGLTALASPSGKWVLISFVSDDALHMNLVNTSTGEDLPLPIATLTDKCVWTADDAVLYCGVPQNPTIGLNYPDDWYQGAVAFSDRIWKIQVAGRYAQLVLDFPTETKDSLDAEALAVDPASTVLVFVNKNDGSLWSYKL